MGFNSGFKGLSKTILRSTFRTYAGVLAGKVVEMFILGTKWYYYLEKVN